MQADKQFLTELLYIIQTENINSTQFKIILDNLVSNFFVKTNSINENMTIDNYYLKDSNGIVLSISNNFKDGTDLPHRGADIVIRSTFSNYLELDLYFNDEKVPLDIEKAITYLYNINFEAEDFIDLNEPVLLTTLREDKLKDEAFMHKALIYSYINIEKQANAEYMQYDNKSKDIKSIYEIMYNSINDLKVNPDLYIKMITLFDYHTHYITQLFEDTKKNQSAHDRMDHASIEYLTIKINNNKKNLTDFLNLFSEYTNALPSPLENNSKYEVEFITPKFSVYSNDGNIMISERHSNNYYYGEAALELYNNLIEEINTNETFLLIGKPNNNVNVLSQELDFNFDLNR